MKRDQKNRLVEHYPDIKKLSTYSGQSTYELIMVYMDDKPAAAEAVFFDQQFKNNFSKIQKIANKLGLFFATSDYKYIINSPEGIFSEIPLNDKRLGKIIISFSKSPKKAKNGAIYYHHKMLDTVYGYKFGELMGYPKCCLEFGNYLANNDSEPNNLGFKNPAIESLKRSAHLDWRLNTFAISLIPHFPCRLDCPESITYVKKLLSYIELTDPQQAKEHISLLTQPATLAWTCADRILLYGKLETSSLGTGKIKYNKVVPWITSNSFYQKNDQEKLSLWKKTEKYLKKGNRLIVTDNDYQIYKDERIIFSQNKKHPLIPVLIKPDILP